PTRGSSSATWSRPAASRRSTCSRSTSTRCTPRACANAPRASRATRRRPGSLRAATDAMVMPSPPAAARLAVLGAGSWGTALAALTARHGHPTVLWGRDADTIAAIEARHENPRYLPGVPLPATLHATTDLREALDGATLVLVVVPSHAFAETLAALAPHR